MTAVDPFDHFGRRIEPGTILLAHPLEARSDPPWYCRVMAIDERARTLVLRTSSYGYKEVVLRYDPVPRPLDPMLGHIGPFDAPDWVLDGAMVHMGNWTPGRGSWVESEDREGSTFYADLRHPNLHRSRRMCLNPIGFDEPPRGKYRPGDDLLLELEFQPHLVWDDVMRGPDSPYRVAWQRPTEVKWYRVMAYDNERRYCHGGTLLLSSYPGLRPHLPRDPDTLHVEGPVLHVVRGAVGASRAAGPA